MNSYRDFDVVFDIEVQGYVFRVSEISNYSDDGMDAVYRCEPLISHDGPYDYKTHASINTTIQDILGLWTENGNGYTDLTIKEFLNKMLNM